MGILERNTQSEHASLAVIEKQIELFCKIIGIFHPEITFWEAEKQDLFCRLFFKKSFLEIKIEMLSKKPNPATNFAMDKGDVENAKEKLKEIILSNKHITDIFSQMPSTTTCIPTTRESRRLNKLICKIAEQKEINPNQIFAPNDIPLYVQNFKHSSFKCYSWAWSQSDGFTQLATIYNDDGNETNIELNNRFFHNAELSPFNYANLDNMTAYQLNHDGFDVEACLISKRDNTKKTIHIPGGSVDSHKSLIEALSSFQKKHKDNDWNDLIVRALNKDTTKNCKYIHSQNIPNERMAKSFKLLNSKHEIRFALFKSTDTELLFIHSDFLSSQLPINQIAAIVTKHPKCTHLQLTSTQNPNIHSSWHFADTEYEGIKNYFKNLGFPVHAIHPL